MKNIRSIFKSNKMQKLALLVVIILIVLFFLSYKDIVRWPINITLPIEGIITDNTTGKPIENVVISISWSYSYPIDIDTRSFPYKTQIAVTDKDGNYKIPSETFWLFFKHLSGNRFSVLHPLYESYSGTNVGKINLISYDVKLMSLEEKYGEKAVKKLKVKSEKERTEEAKKIYRELLAYTLGYDNAGYFLVLRRKEINFNIQEIFSKWNSIVMLYNNLLPKEYFELLKERVTRVEERMENRIKQISNEEKKKHGNNL